MKTIKRALLGTSVALALMAGVGAANATLLNISGGDPFVTGSVTAGENNVLGDGLTLTNHAILTATSGATLSFYFLGIEAGFTNTLQTGTTPVISDARTGTNNSDNGPYPQYPGSVPGIFLGNGLYTSGSVLNFLTSGNGTVNMGADNGSDGRASIAFAYLDDQFRIAADQRIATDRVLFALDDGSIDDNHDDYVGIVSASTTVVPLPAAVWMFGSALIGLAGVGRRKLTGADA